MIRIPEPLKNWFGYSRRERRSTFFLLIITISVFGIRLMLPACSIKIEEIPLEMQSVCKANSTKTYIVAEKRNSYEYKSQRRLLDINICDSASLVSLPGIGPVLAVRIIKYRNLLGGYASLNQLREVYGLPEETFRLILPRLCVDSLAVKKIMINKAEFRELIRHPYFKKNEVSAIIKYRELEGTINDMDVLIRNKLISPDKTAKICPYLDFSF